MEYTKTTYVITFQDEDQDTKKINYFILEDYAPAFLRQNMFVTLELGNSTIKGIVNREPRWNSTTKTQIVNILPIEKDGVDLLKALRQDRRWCKPSAEPD
jgi:hypothetical protein